MDELLAFEQWPANPQLVDCGRLYFQYSEGYHAMDYENPVLPQPVFDGMKASVFH